MATTAKTEASVDCEDCKRLQAEVGRLVEQLADARERANALYVAFPPQEPMPAPPPAAAAAFAPEQPAPAPAPATPPEPVAPRPVPLRYRLVDSLNDSFKRYLGPLQRVAKKAIEGARQ